MRRLKLAAIAGLLVATGGVAAIASNQGQTRDDVGAAPSASPAASAGSSSLARDAIGMVEPGEPCQGARHATSIAALATKIPIWVPQGERLTDAWTCGGVPVLMFGGVQVTYDAGYKVDPKKKFAEMVVSDGGRVQTINGRSAYVHPADDRGPRNGVWFLIGEYSIGLTATPDVGIDRVLEVAGKLQFPAQSGD